MHKTRYGRMAVTLGLSCCVLNMLCLSQDAKTQTSDLISLGHITSATALPNGVDVRDGKARIEITALREDVLRVRVSKAEKMPEDASWAVLAGARTSSVVTTYAAKGDKVGFQTKVLEVSMDRATSRLTISDRSGEVLL